MMDESETDKHLATHAARWGERLRALLRHRGWKGRELARRADLSPSVVAEAVRGEGGKLSPKSRRYLAQAFGWPDWEAMMETEALEPPPQRESEEIAAVRRLLREALRRLDDAQASAGYAGLAALVGAPPELALA